MQLSQEERTNLGELKAHIAKKIGVQKSKRYFYYLSRFLSQMLTKREFDKTCFRLLGRDNLSLHNQLIRSILRNATVSKSPPPLQHVANGPEQSGSLAPDHCDHVWFNGERKMIDSPIGSNGNVKHMLQQPLCRQDNNRGSSENGDLRRFNHQRSGIYGNDDENQEEQVRVTLSATPLVVPLGIQFYSASVRGGSFRTSADVMCCYDSGGLPDTELLRKRMENIAVAHGLEGVSMECANTLNTLLDVYLKNLIKSCTDLVGGDPRKQSSDKQNLRITPDGTQDHHSVSLLDFRTAMELNPRQLGQDWPTLRERISMQSFEEQDSEV